MKLNIQTNPVNGGLCAFFERDGLEFYADLCLIHPDLPTECMIFSAHNGQVINWRELYCKRGIPVTEDSLAKCVEEFLHKLKNNDVFPELNQKELRLVLTYKWYDMIEAGEKPEEYRDLTKFYRSRIEGRDYDIVTFYRGYEKDRKTMSFKYGGYRVGTGQEKWGAVPGKQYYVIKLGERL